MFKCSTPGTIMRIWRFQCFRFNRLHTFVAIAMYRARSTCVRHFCVSVYQRRMCSIIKFIVNRNRIVVVFFAIFFSSVVATFYFFHLHTKNSITRQKKFVIMHEAIQKWIDCVLLLVVARHR